MKALHYFGPGWRGHLIALVAGASITPSLAPLDIWPLGIVSIFVYILTHHQLTAKQAIWRSWFYGFGLFVTGTSWVYVSIHEHGNAPALLATLLTLLFTGGIAFFLSPCGYLFTKFIRGKTLHANRFGLMLGFPALWALTEWFRLWFLTGFPWMYVGYAHQNTWLSGWAPIFGVIGVSFFVALTASILAYLFLARKELKPVELMRYISALTTCWLLGLMLSQISWVHKSEKPVSVALIQPNIPQAQKWDPFYRPSILRQYTDMTEPLWHHDIIVWPETAVPMIFSDRNAQEFLSLFAEKATQANSTLITGIVFRAATEERRYLNGVLTLGKEKHVYYKRHLVVFGEYVPLENILRGLIGFFDLPMSRFVAGPYEQPPIIGAGLKILPFICYEVAYPDLVVEQASEADMLLTISNDMWFGESFGPPQHMQMVQMRALETGRYVIRGTNNGITAIIDEKGDITALGKQFSQATVTGNAYAMRGNTPYNKTKNWPIILLSCLLVLVAIVLNKESHSSLNNY